MKVQFEGVEGTIHKKSGRDTFILVYKDSEGVKRNKSLGVKTVVEAKDAAKSVLRNLSYAGASKKRLSHLLDFFIQNSLTKKAGLEKAIYHFNVFIDYFNNAIADNITSSEVAEYRKYIARLNKKHKGTGTWSVTYQNNNLRCVKQVYNFARKHDLISDRNIFKSITVKENKPVNRYFTKEQILKVLDVAASEPVIRAFILFLFESGFRSDELYNLKWEDVFLNDRYLIIRNQKNQDVDQRFQINDGMFEALTILKEYQHRNATYVVSQLNGKRYIKDTFTKNIKRIFVKAGFPDHTTHDTRRTYITQLLLDGYDLLVVNQLARHKTLEQTRKYFKDNLSKIHGRTIDISGRNGFNKQQKREKETLDNIKQSAIVMLKAVGLSKLSIEQLLLIKYEIFYATFLHPGAEEDMFLSSMCDYIKNEIFEFIKNGRVNKDQMIVKVVQHIHKTATDKQDFILNDVLNDQFEYDKVNRFIRNI